MKSTALVQTLEEQPTGFCPDAALPVLCEHCVDVLHEHTGPQNWKEMRAMRQGASRYEVLDYAYTSDQRCRCCHSTAWGARYYVNVTSKAC